MYSKYGLKLGQIVYFKCRVTEINDNCVIHVEGVNCGESDIKFKAHPNSLFPFVKNEKYEECLTSTAGKWVCGKMCENKN